MKCKKKRFSKINAKIALASAQGPMAGASRYEVRYYYCGECKAWHLTSQGLTSQGRHSGSYQACCNL